MRELKCDGCGMREDATVSDRNQKIRAVKLLIKVDARNWPESEDHHEADLCPNCRGILLHTYFSQPAEGGLVVPAFLEPTERERRRA